jgi:glycosyltransferase involved in cell wall biosynthesis
MPKARLLPFVREAEAVLMPSRIDNYPNACLEAQALGVPVIGTRGSSLEEMIEDGITGFLVDGCDAPSVAAAIERRLRQSAEERAHLRARMGRAIEEIGREDRIGQLIALYQRTVDRFSERDAHG